MTTTEARTAIYSTLLRCFVCFTAEVVMAIARETIPKETEAWRKAAIPWRPKSRRAPPQNTTTHPSSWLGLSARPGVAHKPAGKVDIVAAGAPPITRLEFDGNAMRIVADDAPPEVVVPASRAESIALSDVLK